MENSKYKSLIIRHLEDNIHDEDLVALLNWLDEDPDNRKFFFQIKDIWDSRRSGHVSLPELPLWKKALPQSDQVHKIPYWRALAVRIGKYAALIAITATVTMFLQKKHGVEIKENIYHQVMVQNGNQSQQIVLSDGTRVWINASGSLKYPETFDSEQRTVWLDGEAYFEVAENKAHPFVVHTDMMDVKVVGTSFNLTAYASDRKLTTTLVEGKVELWTGNGKTAHSATLEPGQQAVFLKDENRIVTQKVDPTLYVAWKDGYYKFNNTSFGEIAERLERMYHIKITFVDQSLLQIPYTGTFAQKQSLTEVLEIMCSVKPFKYTIQNNQITIQK